MANKRGASRPAATGAQEGTALLALRAPAQIDRAAGPARTRFERLLGDLQARRDALRAWAEALPDWRQRYHARIVPLLEQQRDLDLALIELLDHASISARLSRAEHAVLSERVCALAMPLIDAGHAALRPVYARHRAQRDERDVAEAEALSRHCPDEALGLAAEETDVLDSAEAVFEQAQAQARERARQAHAEQRRAKRRARAHSGPGALATEQAPLRELYRRLAAGLHPDRARDSADSVRRTALMQRLNAAYKAGDLLGLLELQAELGLLDAAGVDAFGEQKLARYNLDLAAQCRQLDQQLAQVCGDFCVEYGLDLPRRPKPEQLGRLLARMGRALEEDLAGQRLALRELDPPAGLKRWLKWQQRPGPGVAGAAGGAW